MSPANWWTDYAKVLFIRLSVLAAPQTEGLLTRQRTRLCLVRHVALSKMAAQNLTVSAQTVLRLSVPVKVEFTEQDRDNSHTNELTVDEFLVAWMLAGKLGAGLTRPACLQPLFSKHFDVVELRPPSFHRVDLK